jgi:hypothetical protein
VIDQQVVASKILLYFGLNNMVFVRHFHILTIDGGDLTTNFGAESESGEKLFGSATVNTGIQYCTLQMILF